MAADGAEGSGEKNEEGRENLDFNEDDSDWYEDDEELQLTGKEIRQILHLQSGDILVYNLFLIT